MESAILHILDESIKAKRDVLKTNLPKIVSIVEIISNAFQRGKKLMLFGNGGSAADAQHLAGEFVNRFLIDRPPLPALALTTDTSVITSISNDFDYIDIFAKQIQALAQPGDIALGISTSGRSQNVINGLEKAKTKDLITIGLGGSENSPMQLFCDYYIAVSGVSTPRIQEIHSLLGHIIAEMIDEVLFGKFKSRMNAG